MKTSIEKRLKICIFAKELVHGFRKKSEIFLCFVFIKNRPDKVLY